MAVFIMNEVRCLSLLIFVTVVNNACGISCKNERNEDVDWFIFYKLPKIGDESSKNALGNGTSYAFITSEDKKEKWELSSYSIESSNSILGMTWRNYAKAAKSDVSYLFYNDDPPGDITKTSQGHTKGIIAFDSSSGFWLRHSIPNFGESGRYEYPSSAMVNGQNGICITFHAMAFKDICQHMLYSSPNIYASRLSKHMAPSLDKTAKTLFGRRPAFVRKAPFTLTTQIHSLGRQPFLLISKDNQLEVDLYSDMIAPTVQSALLAETWRRGAGTSMPSACRTTYPVVNIREIKMDPYNFNRPINFKSTEDHSKWAMSLDQKWICIADLNRMESQGKRAGGATCIECNRLWKAFRSLIYETDECPT